MDRKSALAIFALLASGCFDDGGNPQETSLILWDGGDDTDETEADTDEAETAYSTDETELTEDDTDVVDTEETDSDETDTDETDTGETDTGETPAGNPICSLEGLVDPGQEPAVAGEPVHHFAGLSAHDGKIMNICELAGTPILLTTSAMWCGACSSLASCLRGEEEQCWAGTDMGLLRDRLLTQKILAVTIVARNAANSPDVTKDDLAEYYFSHGLPNGYMMVDLNAELWKWLPSASYPHVVSIDEQFNYVTVGGLQPFADLANL